MKQLNVCLILCITIFATATNAFQFSSLLEVQELKKSLFGSNLIETIALTFDSDDRVASAKEVLSMLEDLRNQLVSDQENDSALYESKKHDFEEHIAKLDAEIQELTERIDYLASEIERLTGLIAQADLNIASFQERIKNLKELLSEMHEANERDNKYYNQKIEELQHLYNAFSSILEKLEALTGSVSGVNVYSHINLTDAEKRDVEWSKENPGVASKLEAAAVKSFLQVESESSEMASMVAQLSKQYTNFLENTLNADQGALAKLKSLLSTMQEDVLAQKTQTEKHLDSINLQYGELKEGAEKEIIYNEDALKSQMENREHYLAERGAYMEEKFNKEQRRDLLRKEREINDDLRGKLKNTFEKEKADRAVELDVTKKLISIVERRLVDKSF